MRVPLFLALLLFCSFSMIISPQNLTMSTASTPGPWPTTEWELSTPEAQGIDAETIQNMEDYINETTWRDDIFSLLIVRNGYLVYENYFGDPSRVDQANEIHSCTKSVTSLLVGIALAQGHISSVQDFVLDYFPDRMFANMDSRKEAITIEHLLTMTSGLPWDESSYPWGHPLNDYSACVNSSDWVQWVLDRPMEYAPGDVWVYNTGGSHVLSAIVSEASGMNTSVFANEYLFSPIGITNYAWPSDSNGHAMGGSDLYLTPRNIAKIGYLALRGGTWERQTVVPLSWILTASTNHHDFIPNTPDSNGYGYQWWTYPRLGAYCARGYLGQYIWVIPSHDLVVVITGNSNNIDDGYLVERYIMPATPPLPPPLDPRLILLPLSVGICITIIISIIYWKRRTR
ncbi:MAG: serine hydrolase domain-containing protein [Candidatus Thorarchaeota archaeon]